LGFSGRYPVICSSSRRTLRVKPMKTTLSTTVGSPHHRISESQMISSLPVPDTFFHDDSDSASRYGLPHIVRHVIHTH